jgi:nucleotide-binding universal stress UspA family protein
VLVIPRTGDAPPGDGFARRVLLAWDGSREAAAAMGAAVPLLAARRVGDGRDAVRSRAGARRLRGPAARPERLPGAPPGQRRHPGARTARYGGDTGHALLSVADELGAGLLVMGCYGHSRLRELCLGGASRTVLAETRIPTLLAH